MHLGSAMGGFAVGERGRSLRPDRVKAQAGQELLRRAQRCRRALGVMFRVGAYHVSCGAHLRSG